MPIISPIQSPYLGEVTIGSGSLLIGSVNVPGSLTITNTASNINIINSAGWIVTDSAQLLAGVAAVGSVGILGTIPVNVLNSAGWVIAQSNTGGAVNIINTAGGTVSIINSSGWVVSVSNTASNVNIVNSAGWLVNVANTAQSVNVINSAGWAINVVNSAGWPVAAAQSGTWTIANTASAVSIINSAGWVLAISNTAGQTTSIINSAGWTVGVGSTSIVNSAGWAVNVVNSAGWPVAAAQSGTWTIANTATNINVINSAGWVTTTSAQLLSGVAAVGSVGVLGTIPVSQSGTWRVILATSENLIGTMNTIAIGAGTNVNIVNSAGWVVTDSAQLLAGVAAVGSVGILGTVPVSQSGTWRVILVTSENLIGTMNTIAIGAGTNVNIVNSAGWVVTDSAQLLAGVAAVGSVGILGTVPVSQSGTWRVILATSENLIGTMNTIAIGAGTNVNIVNSAGWVTTTSAQLLAGNALAGSMTALLGPGVTAVGSVSILNPISVVNTAGMTVNVINSAGWIVSQINTAGLTVNVINSAGWAVNQINTAGMTVSVINTAGMTLGASTAMAAAQYTITGVLINESGKLLAVQTATSRATAAGNTLILAALSNNAYRVLGYRVQALTTSTVKFTDSGGTSSDLTPTFLLGDREGFVATAYHGGFEFQTATSRGLYVNLAAVGTTTTLLHYVVTS